MINNAQIDVVSDRQTKFNLKYVNQYKNRDLEINVDRIPGQEAHVTIGKTDGSKMMDLKFTATDLNPGDKLEIEGKKNGNSMWKYSTKRTTIDNAQKYDMTLTTDMTLNSQSIFYKLLEDHYPYGAFNERRNEIRIFIDRQNKNFLFPKFLVDVKLYKEGEKVVTLNIDSRTSPYTFLFIAPNVFDRWNINMDKIEGQMTHVPGSSINIETNLGGGIKINAQRGNNNKGGRDIQIRTEKAGKQMMKVEISTEKTVNDNEIKLVLRDAVEVDPDSVLYRRIVRN